MIALLTCDIIASEAKYHHSCYTDYTRKNYTAVAKEASQDQTNYKQTELKAFHEVVQFCFEL